MSASEPIRLRDVRKVYGDVVALDGVSLAVEAGALHCLAGPNGSGKTTLLRLVLGLTEPTEGTVATETTPGTSFQTPSLFEDLTVAGNLDTFGAVAGGVEAEWRETVVERLGLGSVLGRVVGDLSGGFRRRTDLALALIRRPALVVVDEPLGDLDDAAQHRVVGLLSGYDGTVLVSTHDLSAFGPHCDHLTVLHDGRVALDAAGDELEDPADRYRDLVGEWVPTTEPE